MGFVRPLLLRAAESEWLGSTLPRRDFVRRSVRRFLPGETLDAALEAAEELGEQGIATVLTQLGEEVAVPDEAEAAAEHYLGVLERVADGGRDVEISVKPTHLGLDLSRELAAANLRTLVRKAEETGGFVWVDMEKSRYLEDTLAIFREAREDSERIGICLQAYLYRTSGDIGVPLYSDSSVRLVKGAYREPREIAYTDRDRIDHNFVTLGWRMLKSARERGVRHAFATHDERLVRRIQEVAKDVGTDREQIEFQMLYGIRPALQRELVEDGWNVRVLVTYGDAWFAWYLRRLAERPANLGLLVRNLLPS